jgi:copper chaperone CopZ
MITTFRVKGMTTIKSTKAVREALENVPGIEEASPDMITGVVVVIGQNLVQTELIEAIESAGCKVVG